MTLPSAPSAISFNDISLELWCTLQPFNLNDAFGRCLACLPTPNSTISLSNFYGKTTPVVTLGTCMCGGWYMGCTTACGVNYYLIAAPALGGYVSGCFRCWGPVPTVPNACQNANLPVFSPGPVGTNPTAQYDGFCGTKFIQACPNYNPTAPLPAGCTFAYPMHNQILGLTLGGFSDWYFPAATELQTLYCNTDYSWKCGIPSPTLCNMKSTGNQFPAGIPLAINAPAAGSPGCWPYLGYATWGGATPCIPAPGSGFLFGLSNPNNGWNPTNTPQISTSMCVPPTFIPGGVASTTVQSSLLGAQTQATGQPQGIYSAPLNPGGNATGSGIRIDFGTRLLCANCAVRAPGGGPNIPNVYPTATSWLCDFGRTCCALTRAVRRVAI